ncbi:MAG: hypothetical protein H6Q89_4319 [Myxococcaceae bacterium]|nr:hypothetical protein [Myxococcaceae bacterium]
MRLLILASLFTALVVHAEDLTPEKRAKLQRDQQKAAEAVEKKYGNKKASELSSEERKSLMKEKAAAEREVLEKAGVDPKEYARSQSKMSREDRANTDAAGKELEAKEAAAAKDGAGKKTAKKEIVIEKNGKSAGDPEVNEAAELDKQMGLKRGK